MGINALTYLAVTFLGLMYIFKLFKWIVIFINKKISNSFLGSFFSKFQDKREAPCLFEDGISQSEFVKIVESEASYISHKRLRDVTVSWSTVYGTVRSQSGLSDWSFSLDFNDFGHLTGRFWSHSDNADSILPNSLGKRISYEIQKRCSQ